MVCARWDGQNKGADGNLYWLRQQTAKNANFPNYPVGAPTMIGPLVQNQKKIGKFVDAPPNPNLLWNAVPNVVLPRATRAWIYAYRANKRANNIARAVVNGGVHVERCSIAVGIACVGGAAEHRRQLQLQCHHGRCRPGVGRADVFGAAGHGGADRLPGR
jgi:hypothetical protein